MNQLLSRSRRMVLAGSLAVLFVEDGAIASGFHLPEGSAAGIGLANALVANPEDPGAFAYNPAAMGFHDGSSLSVGAYAINPSFNVETASGSHDSYGADWVGAPMLQAALRVDDQWRIGLGFNIPFGLETRWKLGTYPDLSTPIPAGPSRVLPPGLDHPAETKLEVLALFPTAAYRVSDNLSIAAGIDYYNGRTALLNTHFSELEGDGDAWGWNLGFLYTWEAWSFGATYHSAATIDIDGTVTSPISSEKAEVDLNLPWRLQVGVRYAFSPALALEVDWSRSGWSEFDELRIVSKVDGSILGLNEQKWKDTNAIRMGLSYAVLPTTLLRFGYTYDETGQGDDYFTGRVPDSDRHLFSVGIGHDLGGGWAIDAGYMYISFKDRNYRGDKAYRPLPRPADINGTRAIDGDYQSSAHLLGLDVRKSF